MKRTIAMVVLTAAGTAAVASGVKVPPTTPPGITLIEVVLDGGSYGNSISSMRLGDGSGRTVLAFDPETNGSIKCVDACAQEWHPVPAERNAQAFGDWSVVNRADGTRQWSYQSHPLYTWTKEQEAGTVANAVLDAAKPNFAERGAARATALIPPPGWQLVRFDPAASLRLPDGLDARHLPAAQAVALVSIDGLTLYRFDGDVQRDGQVCTTAGCEIRWMPVAAPALASAAGGFSVVSRVDGSRQWAYGNQPLYTYSGDKVPGDAHGIGVDRHWQIAAIGEDFRPPHVVVQSLGAYGDVVTLNGMTLYGAYPFEKRWGGRNLRDQFAHNIYTRGKKLGTESCTDAECLKQWHPLIAPRDARAQGFWEPVARSDGTRQWSYKGYALYTFAGDRAPGQRAGQGVYAFEKFDGSDSELKHALFVQSISPTTGGNGIYWNIAQP